MVGYLRPGTAQLSSGCPADDQNTPHITPFMLKFQNKTSQLKPRQTIISPLLIYRGFPGFSDSKESACNANDLSLIPVSGRSPEEGYGNLLQYSCLENSMERGAWRATVHRVVKSQIQLSKTLTLFMCVCVCVCVCACVRGRGGALLSLIGMFTNLSNANIKVSSWLLKGTV